MKKLLTFLTLLTLFFATGWAADVTDTWTATSGALGSSSSGISGSITTSGNKSWTYVRNKYVYAGWNTNASCIQLGSSSGAENITFFTSAYGNATIKSVSIVCASYQGKHNISITVGGTTYLESTAVPTWSNNTLGTKTGTGNSSGEIEIKITDGTKALYIKSISVTYEEGGSTSTTYSVNLNQTTGGTISASPTTAAEGATVTLTATPNAGYEFTSWTVLDENADEVTVTNNQFTMPASDVEVGATFTEASSGSSGRMTFVQTSSSEGTLTNAPTGVTATFSNTYTGNKEQITSGNTMTLTISGMSSRYKITGITLNVHNNKSSGEGAANVTMNGQNIGSLTITGLGNSYSEQDVNITECPFTGDLVITLSCTTNSVFCNAFYIDYEEIPAKTYDVTVTQPAEGGTITASPVGEKVVDAGDKITVTATPDAGYELTGWTITGASESAPDANNQITATGNVTITATFSKIDYTITKGSMTNGTVNVAATANYGDVVTITPEPATDYVVDKVYYNDGTDHEIAVNNNAYTFTMPASNVTVWATFVEYYPTLRLAGRFNGRSTSSWVTDNSGPEFTYDTSTEKYTIDAYFIGASQDEGSDVDFFYLRSDDNDLKAAADGNCWVAAEGGTYTLGGSSNFRIYPGVYNITVNKARTSITFTKITPALTFSPNGGEVEAGQTVTVTSNLQTLVDNIKNTYDSGAIGTVSHSVSTDQNTWSDNITLNTIGSATVYGRAVLGNIYATGNAAYNVVAANTSTQYQLITSTDDLIAGKKYIIVSTGSYTASGTTYNFTKAAGALSGDLLSDVDVTIDENDIIDLASTSGVTEFKLGGSTNAWTFAFSDGLLLTSATSKKMSASEDGTPATISFSGDEAIINMGSVGNLQYNPNSGNGRFTTYTSDQKPVMLFKQVEGTVTQKSAAPVITPEGGNIVGYSQEVEITQANGGTIYYTTDGTTPTETSAQYTGKFWAEGTNLGDEVTITAVAKEEGKELSNPVSVTYKFVAPVAPVFTPAGGTYTTAQEVSISSTTEGADVYYTTTAGLSAAQIVAQGTKFTVPINVSEETTYYAVTVYNDVHANKNALSSVRQAQYKFAEVESVGLPYTRSFTDNSWGEFTREEGNSNITVWTLDGDYGAKGTSYSNVNNYNYAATSWLLSPYINLSNANEPVCTFDHQINKYFSNPSTQATVWIRTYGGEWTQLETSLPTSSSGINGWPKYDEEYDLSAYNGQIVQIGFKYYNPTAGTGAGTWEIQNFKVVDLNQPAIEVNNIAEFMDNTIVPEGSKAKLLNPVVVLYHYQQYLNEDEGDYVNDYIWVKDESGYAIIYGKYLDVNYTNGDVIPAGFTATKFYYNVGRFYQMYYPEGLQPATEKALADPEAVTLTKLNSDKDNYNGHYVTIPKMRIKFSSGELVPYEYDFDTEDSYGGQRNFEIGDATLSISSNNKSIIGYNNFDNPWLETLDYPEYENTTSDYGDYNITGIFERYNGVWEFMPIIITPWKANEVTLHDLCQDGNTDEGLNEYTISNNLLGVYSYYDENLDADILWVKDDNGQSIHMVSPEAPYTVNFAIEFEDLLDNNDNVVIPANTRLEQQYYDQSNWCQLILTGKNGSSFVNKIINGGAIKGNFVDNTNPTMQNVSLNPETDIYSASSYAPNYYVPASFVGSQSCNTDMYGEEGHGDFFFMTPKPQEYATIVWAVWDGQKMNMPTKQQGNSHNLFGEFSIDLSMNQNHVTAIPTGAYSFHAIIRKVSTSGAPALKGQGDIQNDQSASYMVYPLDIDPDNNPSTAINTVEVGNGEIKSIKYVNVAGIVSDKPFQGVNIVVTEYTDGSRTTTKMLHK